MNIKNKNISLWLMVWMVIGICAFAGSRSLNARVSPEYLGKVVIVEEGRIKPLDTFAQNVLKQFSGRSKSQGERAIQWLARVLFTPEQTYEDKVFLVTNQEVLDSIGVKRQGKARARYSFAQLRKSLTTLRQLAVKASRIKGKDRSFIENEIIGLYNKLYFYQQLASSFQFFFPHPDFASNAGVLKILGLPEDKKQLSYFDLLEKKEKILEVIAAAEKKEKEEWTDVEKDVVEISKKMAEWTHYYRELPLAILPGHGVTREGREEKWLSPWDILSPRSEGIIAKELYLMRDFVRAYEKNNQEAFDRAVQAFNALILEKTGGRIREHAISLEVFYNKLDPFYKAKFFYGFCVLFLLLSFIALKKWFYGFSFLLLAVGFLLHIYGTVARMVIMQRPPVTNLYETFLFTGLITVLLGITLELFKKKNIGLLTGGLAGLVMLMIAGKYALEGDTMGMLVAVLDSNFWLASHVITIILGYAGIVLSGFIGHVYLVQKIFRPLKKELLKNTFQAVYAIQAFGIIFTFLGTVLGGIWADQSWGRFWGWDPKENGALLILLWSAILFHAKLAGWVKETGMAFGTVIGVIAVSLAWFGVNLLGVGLHSYGFTSGVAKTLFIFIALEVLFMMAAALMLIPGKKQTAAMKE